MAVSSKKDKLVEEAQKHVLRGQLDKAVKLYEQIMAMDPSSVNLRQKFAELLVKSGRMDDARIEFETIGKYFSKNGFFLKAIAVYKQLQKLFPADFLISLTLAELNEKHGLTTNALSEYKLVFDYYERSGNNAEALKILDRMQTIDPGNVPIKIKLAEDYFKNDKKKDAYALFCKAAAILLERSDTATAGKLNTRVQQLFPEKTDFLLEIFTEQIASGNAANAVNGLQGCLRTNPNDKRAWDLIVEAYKKLDQPHKVRVAYQHYLKFFPNDPAPLIGTIHCQIEDGNIPTSLELLDRYETLLLSAGCLTELEMLYQALSKIDPINVKIIEGMTRVAKAGNKESDVAALTSKLELLQDVAGENRKNTDALEPPPALANTIEGFFSNEPAAPSFATIDDEINQTAEFEVELFNETLSEPESFEADLNPLSEDDIEIEIELDLDEDSDLNQLAAITTHETVTDSWLDSVGGLFDNIETSPSGVRFGSEVENSDAQSHFDLGMAFKEMGLYDEAINEFRRASADNSRRVGCLIMQGACLRERGEYDTAVNMLKTLLNPGLSQEDSISVKYELALAYESTGQTGQATLLLNEIVADNPGFRDVSSRLVAANLESSLDFSDEDLKDFDL
ncbi:MAG: tetratricopeptide repeat protein [Geobacter sp.]|nr:tetratricopeptide repeat protein [Geobacter sp.]